jgi:hypothetical protein
MSTLHVYAHFCVVDVFTIDLVFIVILPGLDITLNVGELSPLVDGDTCKTCNCCGGTYTIFTVSCVLPEQ